MITEPLNDTDCLRLLHAEARRRVRDPRFVALANAFGSPGEIAAFLRTRPHILDQGDPLDGPRIACVPSQRLRLLSDGFNCFEATALYLALAECIDPGTPRTSCTIRVGTGYHTFPVEHGRAVILDPDAPPRNAMDAGAYACLRRTGHRPSIIAAGEAHPWLLRIAANAAQTPWERQAVRNAVNALNHAIYAGKPLDDLYAVAQTLALAETEAGLWGQDGLDALGHASRGVRNLQQRIDLGSYKSLAKRLGKRALQAYLISQLGPLGPALMHELEDQAEPDVPVTAPRPEPAAVPQTERHLLDVMRLH